jgi:hypothetical protein
MLMPPDVDVTMSMTLDHANSLLPLFTPPRLPSPLGLIQVSASSPLEDILTGMKPHASFH